MPENLTKQKGGERGFPASLKFARGGGGGKRKGEEAPFIPSIIVIVGGGKRSKIHGRKGGGGSSPLARAQSSVEPRKEREKETANGDCMKPTGEEGKRKKTPVFVEGKERGEKSREKKERGESRPIIHSKKGAKKKESVPSIICCPPHVEQSNLKGEKKGRTRGQT